MISIIIPMYNSQKTILDTLNGLMNQTVKNYEVIIIDDGSKDSSYDIVNDFISKSTYSIILLKQNNSGPAKARNLGALHANGEIIIFLDSDCIPPENWIEEMIKPVNSITIGSNCGYKAYNNEYITARYVDYEIAKRHEKLINKKIETIGTYSACFNKQIFNETGGFDTNYRTASGEDFDLAFTIAKLKYNFEFTNKTFVYHYHPDNLFKFLKQQYGRGYWRFYMYLKHKDKILKGDSYTGMEAQIQFLLSNILFLSILLILINPIIFILSAVLLFISNMPLGFWIFKKERKFIIFAPLIASARSVSGTLGAYNALIDFLGFRRKPY